MILLWTIPLNSSRTATDELDPDRAPSCSLTPLCTPIPGPRSRQCLARLKILPASKGHRTTNPTQKRQWM